MKKGILKNGVIALCSVVALFATVVFADLTVEQQTVVDTAAVKIASVMDAKGVTPETFRTLLDQFRTGFGEDQTKWDMADALDNAVMDAYYQVENFNQCEVYYDGCNECSKTEEGVMACTLKMCVQHEAPRCLVYKNSQEQADLDAAMALWMEENHDSYTAKIQASCFCTEEYRRPIMYEVVEGVVQPGTAMYADENEEEDEVNLEMSPNLMTVEDLFHMIQEAIDANADSVTVTYHPDLGYPMSVAIDTSFMMADEEQYYNYEITD